MNNKIPFKENITLQSKIAVSISIAVSIIIQAFLLKYISGCIWFAFHFDHYGSGIEPWNVLRGRVDVLLSFLIIQRLFAYELVFFFRKEEFYCFGQRFVKRYPFGASCFFYFASWLVIIAYTVGALYSTFAGITFMFSTDRGIEGFLLYNVLLGMSVIPIVLVIASFIYIRVYRSKRKRTKITAQPNNI